MNAIDAALTAGLADRLRIGAAPGEAAHAGPGGADGTDEATADMLRRERGALADAAGAERLSMWLACSTDGLRIDGEVAIPAGDAGTAIVWSLKDRSPQLVFRGDRTIHHASASDLLDAMADPIGMLRLMAEADAGAVADVVEAFGLRPRWRPDGQPRMVFAEIELETRRD